MSRVNRAPRPLAQTLDSLAHELCPQTVLAEAQRAWREAVGAEIAGRAQPAAERAGVLTIACESSLWAQELDLMSEAIVERLNARLKGGRVARLKCVAGGPYEQV